MPCKTWKVWERKVANDLKSLYNEHSMRVPNSGAFVGGKNAHRMDDMSEGQKRIFDGDVVTPYSICNWKIECKDYTEFKFHQLWTGDNKQLDSWINQVEDGLLWLLLIKVKRKVKLVLFSNQLFGKISTSDNFFKYKEYLIDVYDNFFIRNKENLKQLNNAEEFLNSEKQIEVSESN